MQPYDGCRDVARGDSEQHHGTVLQLVYGIERKYTTSVLAEICLGVYVHSGVQSVRARRKLHSNARIDCDCVSEVFSGVVYIHPVRTFVDLKLTTFVVSPLLLVFAPVSVCVCTRI